VPDVRAVTGVSGKSIMKNFTAMLAEARLPERTVDICLRGDLVAEHEQLNKQLELLEKKAVDSLAGNGGAEQAAKIEALEDRMRDSTYPFVIRAMPRHKFVEFRNQYPVRLDDEGKATDLRDVRFEFNVDTGAEPLVRASVVDPELKDEDWSKLSESLTDSQFEDLFLAAWTLNRRDVDIPFSRAASRLNRLTADDSKPPTG
jgi:hypothetical protein